MEPQCVLNDGKCQEYVQNAINLVGNNVYNRRGNVVPVVDIVEDSKDTSARNVLRFLKIPISVGSSGSYKIDKFGVNKYKHFALITNMLRNSQGAQEIRVEVISTPKPKKRFENTFQFVIVSQHKTHDFVRVNINNSENFSNWIYFDPSFTQSSDRSGEKFNNIGVRARHSRESPIFVCTFIHKFNKYYQEYATKNTINITQEDLKEVYNLYFAPYVRNGMSITQTRPTTFSNSLNFTPAPLATRGFGTNYNPRYRNTTLSAYNAYNQLQPTIAMESKSVANDLSVTDMQFVLYYMYTKLSDASKHARFHSVVKQFFDNRRANMSAVDWKSALDTSLKSITGGRRKAVYYQTWDELYNTFKSSEMNKWSPDTNSYRAFISRLNDQLIEQYKRKTGQADVSRRFFLQVPMSMKKFLEKTVDFTTPAVLLTFNYKFWLMDVLRTNAVRHGVDNANLNKYNIRSLELLSWDFKSNTPAEIQDFKQTFNKCNSLFDEIDKFLEKYMSDIRTSIEESKALETKQAPKRGRLQQSYSVEIGQDQKMLADELMKRLKTDIDEKKFFVELKQGGRDIKPYYFPQRFNRDISLFNNKFDYERWIDAMEFTPLQLEYYSYNFEHFTYYLYGALYIMSKLENVRDSEFTKIVVLLTNSLYQFFKATKKNDNNHEAVCYVLQVFKMKLYGEGGEESERKDEMVKNDLKQLKYFYERVELSCFDEAANAQRIAKQNPLIQRVRELIRVKNS